MIKNTKINKRLPLEESPYFKTAEFLRSINASGMAKFFEFSK